MPRSKEQALASLQNDFPDVRIAGVWYFNDYPEFLQEEAVRSAWLSLLSDEAKSSTALKVNVCEVVSKVEAFHPVIVPHIVSLLESSDPEVVRSITYSACIADCPRLSETISGILGDNAYPHSCSRRVLASELIRMSGSANKTLRRSAEKIIEQLQTDAKALIADVRSIGV